MPWSIKRSPNLPAVPAFHDPERCLHCGHLSTEHDVGVGCLSDGGSKYVEDAQGNGKHACSCLTFVPAVSEETNAVA